MTIQKKVGCIPSQFWQIAEKHSNKVAIVDKEQALTYAAFSHRTNVIAQTIVSTSPTEDPGELCAILIDHSAEMLCAIMACIIAGKGYFPIDTSFPIERIKTLLENSRVNTLLTNSKYLSNLVELRNFDVHLIQVDALDVEKVEGRIAVKTQYSSPAYMLSTSGTSGVPKCIIHSQKSLIRGVNHYLNDLNVNSGDSIALVLPYTYTPSLFCIFGAFLTGASIHLFDLKSNSIEEMCSWLEVQRISLLYCSPTIFRRVMQVYGNNKNTLSLRSVQLAGEVLFNTDVEAWKQGFSDQFSLYNGMGTTETGCLTRYFVDADVTLKSSRVPIGNPYDDVIVKIIDEQGNEILEFEREGELVVSADFLPREYVNQSANINSSFSYCNSSAEQVIYRTGDRVMRNFDNQLVHLGRMDSQIKLRGQRVELAEIESKILSSGIATEAAVFYHENSEVPFISAFFQPSSDIGAMRRYLCSVLPPYMIPTRIVSLPSLPTNVSGKIDRKQLQNYQFDLAVPENDKDSSEITDQIEEKVLECFRRILKKQQINKHSSFFACGGDSLSAVEMAIQLQESLAIPVNVSTLIESPTPYLLAREARNLLYASGSKHLVQFYDEEFSKDRNIDAVPIFCLPGLSGNALTFRALASEILKFRAVYAFDYPGFEGSEINFTTLEELASICINEINRVYPVGPVALVAYSLGGVIGHEVCRQLTASGRQIETFVLMDCYDPMGIQIRHIRDFYLHIKRNVKYRSSLMFREKTAHDLTQEKYNTAKLNLTSAIFKYKPIQQQVTNPLLIIANEQKKLFGVINNHRQWFKLLNNQLNVRCIDGDHYTIINSDHVPEVSRLINGHISPAIEEKAQLDTADAIEKIKDIWRFSANEGLSPTPVDGAEKDHLQYHLLNRQDQLTKHLEQHLNVDISPRVIASEQRGRFYYRKVALNAQQSDKLLVIAVIRIAMDNLPDVAVREIIDVSEPFGKILTKHDVEYECTQTTVFSTLPNSYLKSEFDIQDGNTLLGRKNHFKTQNGKTLADVVEILAPWV